MDIFGICYAYDKVSANNASSFPQCYEKYDGSQDARRGSLNASNQLQDQKLSEFT